MESMLRPVPLGEPINTEAGECGAKRGAKFHSVIFNAVQVHTRGIQHMVIDGCSEEFNFIINLTAIK